MGKALNRAFPILLPLVHEVVQFQRTFLIGTAISLSGPYANGAGMTQIPNCNMWFGEVNAKGGLFIKDPNKRLGLRGEVGR